MIEQSDRAVMLDEVIEYVKFLRLQVKVRYTLSVLHSKLTLPCDDDKQARAP